MRVEYVSTLAFDQMESLAEASILCQRTCNVDDQEMPFRSLPGLHGANIYCNTTLMRAIKSCGRIICLVPRSIGATNMDLIPVLSQKSKLMSDEVVLQVEIALRSRPGDQMAL